MTRQPQHPCSPEKTADLGVFARACRTALRAVSLYPAGHPAVGTALSQLVAVSDRITGTGAFRLTVRPGVLAVDDGVPSRPDTAVTELAETLHAHLVGTMVVHAGTDTESWRTLLLLLSRTPEAARDGGGVALMWRAAGGHGVEIQEIDYAEVLRERAGVGEAAAVEVFIEACLKDTPVFEVDKAALQRLLELAADPDRLDSLTAHLLERAAAGSPGGQAEAFVRFLRGLAELTSQVRPELLDRVLDRAAEHAGAMSVEALLAVLIHRQEVGGPAGVASLVDGVVGRMGDDGTARFVARSVVRERGASDRLAEALEALVPDRDRKREIVEVAGSQAAASELGQDTDFPALWQAVEGMLLSYSDESFVPEAYARELSAARRAAVAVEQMSDDPPERIAAWIATVNDAALRSLDLEMLVDLVALETDAARWRDLSDIVATQLESLARAGEVGAICRLARALASVSREAPSDRVPIAAAVMDRLAHARLIRHLAPHLRTCDEETLAQTVELTHILGTAVIDTLAEMLAGETDARSRARLRDILISFGSAGRESAERLMQSENWEVRRTAAYLVREFGGSDALPALEPLLGDVEPLVQREALQAIVRIGEDQAFAMVVRALDTSTTRTRDTLIQELAATRDPRAAPLYCYLLDTLDHRSALNAAYLTAVTSLGALGQDERAVEALRGALYRGEWWAPIRTRRLRDTAAAALARMATPAALDALRQAAESGPAGVRRAARSHLAAPEGSRT